jgi:DNA replication protein DnaC
MSRRKPAKKSSTTIPPNRPTTARAPTPVPPSSSPRERLLSHLDELGLRLTAEQRDELLAESERQHGSHLDLLERVLAVPANERRERSLARRLAQAKLRDPTAALDGFDGQFNPALDRLQIEALATGDFVRRHDNLILVGQSGLGKSRLIQSVARGCCLAGYRVRYTTSAELLRDLGASLADGTTPKRLREYGRFDLLIVDEFGFDQLEREEFPQAPSLLYKLLDHRTRRASTAVVTNIDFDAWGSYLGDAPLAMAFLDRLVDGAIVLKFRGRSYRAHRAQPHPTDPRPVPHS